MTHPNRPLRLRVIAPAAMSLFTLGAIGCVSERPVTGYSEADFAEVPDGYLPSLGRTIESGTLSGAIAGTPVDAPARVRAARGTGTVGLELATNTDGQAVMHLLEIDEVVLGELRPGDTVTYTAEQNRPVMIPIACSGPVLDEWAEEVVVQRLDLSVSEEDDGRWNYDWTMDTWHEAHLGDELETSSGRMVLAPDAAPDVSAP